jgi:hypothetical protein
MAGRILLAETGRQSTVGLELVALGTVLSGAGTYALTNSVVIPAVFPQKSVYEEHHRNVNELNAANRDLKQVLITAEQAGLPDAVQGAREKIAGNNQQITLETSQYPDNYNPTFADLSAGGAGVLAGALVFTALKRAYQKHAQNDQ